MTLKLILVVAVEFACLVSGIISSGSDDVETLSMLSLLENDALSARPSSLPQQPFMVNLTLIQGADSKGAVCLDGTLPGYHLDRGFDSGVNSWLVHLEGGGWCDTIRNCVYRKKSRRGSSIFMESQIPFTGILSNKPEENPDFFNWNRVKLRYCDGASFSGDSEDEAAGLQFRGQKIWLAAMEELMSQGMQNADQALLSGCSAGGLASIIHCDEFQSLFPKSSKVKCFSDAGFFIDAVDISGGRTLRKLFGGVVQLQEVHKNLPERCLSKMDPTSCFFPQNRVEHIETPLFLLNAAYDVWQVQASLAPPSADPLGNWNECRSNHANCNTSQIQFLQDFRNQMLNDVKDFSEYSQTGLFINSCFAHCQSERQETWFADNSPLIGDKPIAIAVGDWYFDREVVKAIDCAYPCGNNCHNLVFNSSITAPGLLEQINVTRDASDYLWYITNVDIGSTESFLRGGELPTFIVQSTGHAVHVFVNGQLSGSAFGTREYRRFTYTGKVNLRAGTNRITLLSVAIGLPNVGEHFETWSTGILGPVAFHGLNQGKLDLSQQKWTYQVGLQGETMNLASPNGISSVEWMQSAIVVQRNQPLTWHKTYFNAPEGDEPLALDMEGMRKGQIWINGQSIGRYWTAFANGNCNDCNYAGTFRPPKCQVGCGQPTQRWYHVPRSWLKPTQNLLVIFEELGGDPSKISLVKRSAGSVCADVSEYHPNIKNWHIESYGKSEEFHPPKIHLHCSPGQIISSIKFASFGTPFGTCGNYVQGACHSSASYTILEKKCIGKQRCIVTVSNSNFGKDPCPRVMKRLSVEAVCSPAATN